MSDDGRRVFVLAFIAMIFNGCSGHPKCTDLREEMLESSRQTDSQFPDGNNEILTKFSHIGNVRTSTGILHVASVSSVLANMPAPRGKAWIAVFDDSRNFVGRQSCGASPLWCEGSLVFLHGLENNGETAGNAWDFSDGFEARRLTLEERYGSYLEDNGRTAKKPDP